MSFKDNVDFVKEELTTQEQFIENFVKAEKFYKKYKMKIIALLVILFITIIGFIVNNYIEKKNKIKANEAFAMFLQDPKNADALKTLESTSKDLFEIANFMIAKKENKETTINVKYLKELNEFDLAVKKNDLQKLDQLSMNDDFLLKEYAIFYKALLLAEQDKIKEAKNTLKTIPSESNLKELVNLLEHYLTTKG